MAKAPYVAVHVKSSEPGRRVGAREIADSIAREINDGRLPAGARLPPVRALEQQLGSSKNTVQAAYEELVARGLIVARARDGVYVTHDDEVAPREPLREAAAVKWAEPLLTSADRR